MNMQETIENAKANIRQAIRDYREHTSATEVLDDITDTFIDRLAEDSTHAKQELRELFSKSPVWDEKLDALVINGTRTHNPDPKLIEHLAFQILRPAFTTGGEEKRDCLTRATRFFTEPDAPPELRTDYINAINAVAPKAYAPNKKSSRIFRAICDALQITDDSSGSEFQRLYAQFADELTARKISYKLFVSLNPAHFLTMSNPKNDNRGNTLTSCHSFNSTEYEYNAGCVGYARDKVSFIVFTASDPKEPETLNNRKTTRQTFAYKPGNGLLMQSRLYNTAGGTPGAQEESQLYRDLVQRELSEIEDVPNLWKTYSYLNDSYRHCVNIGDGFGGYADWTYEGFDGKVSIRNGSEESYQNLTVGTYGLCIRCGEEIRTRLYCEDCNEESPSSYCSDCEEDVDSDDLYPVHDSHNNEIYVCGNCRDEYYSYCERCGDYHHQDRIREVGDIYVCDDCLDEYYTECADCGEYERNEDMYTAYDERGREVQVCYSCLSDHYVECFHCEQYIHESNIVSAHDINGNDIDICDDCRDKYYTECSECGEIHDNDVIVEGLCPTCAEAANEENKEEAI
jgi:hypothetical protein